MKRACFLLFALPCLGIGIIKAQYTVLYNFNNIGKEQHDFYISSQSPYGTLTLSGNKLYGTIVYGGVNNYGCIFSIDTNGSGYKDIHDFDSLNGKNSYGSLTYSAGVLYGMTAYSGANNYGCIYSIDTNGNNFKDLLNFNDTNGANPYGSLIFSGGLLYGMAWQGGANIYFGDIFSIDTNGKEFKDLFDFNGANGNSPYGSLILSGKKLYGMTWGGSEFTGIFSP